MLIWQEYKAEKQESYNLWRQRNKMLKQKDD